MKRDIYKVLDELFETNDKCDKLYEEVYNAKLRINELLGTDEHPDIELIINNMFGIAKEMYVFDNN